METSVEESFNLLDYLPWLYVLGLIVFSIRFFLRLISLARVIKKNESHKKDGYIFIETTAKLSPFSFFKWIVYNPNQLNPTELAQIITHEKVHAKQYHSIDILLMEICCVFLWFYPFVWLYNKSLKQNLEFLADKYALNQCNDTKSYQYTLLKASIPNPQMALSNHFYNSLIKKRIAMIQKSKSKKINLLKYALVVPVLALFLMSFNIEEVYLDKQINGIIKGNDSIGIELKSKTSIIKESHPLYIVNGKEATKEDFDSMNRNNIKLINVLKDKKAIEKYGEKGKEGVVEITSKWTFEVLGQDGNIVGGKEMTRTGKESLSPDNIQSMNVLKDEKTIEEYGGKEEMLIAMKKEKDSVPPVSKSYPDIKVVSSTNDEESESLDIRKNEIEVEVIYIEAIPLYIIDGNIASVEKFKNININHIQSMNVLKRKKAMEVYGERAKFGAVEITMKEIFTMILDKRTSNDKLEVYKKSLKKMFDKDLTYNVIRNSENEIIVCDIEVSGKGHSFKMYGNKPITPVVLIYNKKTKEFTSKTYNNPK
ncbi:M56 family metallopeptidase [Wenyingzhuangia sp. 2_MG-2023]|uniref:M56 family metallopeptidase n=1 Tax=Wenyingzhuangia sp. 2_MG-2023 TaxID=3062639 RepID=UPI0026E1DCCC|nr:M56 family metallopeptidase [Wenyingzhuangia sp. 2_MG-2023]MDO6738856.1 M56 family metallopeptidase [Wenyingzhuangia sp. 2_MG-2023]